MGKVLVLIDTSTGAEVETLLIIRCDGSLP